MWRKDQGDLGLIIQMTAKLKEAEMHWEEWLRSPTRKDTVVLYQECWLGTAGREVGSEGLRWTARKGLRIP